MEKSLMILYEFVWNWVKLSQRKKTIKVIRRQQLNVVQCIPDKVDLFNLVIIWCQQLNVV